MSDNNAALSSKINELLIKIHSKEFPLSQCVAEALEIARKVDDTYLEEFCENELKGWDAEDTEALSEDKLGYRIMDCFFSPYQINMQFLGWGDNASNIINYMKGDKDNFFPYKLLITYPVSKIEAMQNPDARKGIVVTEGLNRPDFPGGSIV